MSFMAKVLKGVAEVPLKQPDGVVVARVNPDSGLRESDDRAGIPEYFYAEFMPRKREDALATDGGQAPPEVRNQLF
jgi:penicillin-binding protein 1A